MYISNTLYTYLLKMYNNSDESLNLNEYVQNQRKNNVHTG